MEGNQRGGDTTAQLGTAPIGGLLLKLALPTVVAQLVNLLYNIVDRIYIGHMPDVGTVALTGVGLCFPVTYLISAFTYLVAQGGAPRAAIAMGQGNDKTAEEIMGNCFTCLIAVSLVLTAAFWLWGEPLLWLFGCSEETIIYALPYMRIYAGGSIFVMMALGMNLSSPPRASPAFPCSPWWRARCATSCWTPSLSTPLTWGWRARPWPR